eukprot:TRINITY_DN7669_c0_g1_i2.p1 TRINITY_DN7669_c0_g1~~TRINITY_DN7669_c0_g1_i2.p1  ORF type:complete len:212 (-),score=69.78 TRINITY_DN7669_c0_g1_i2:22-657(-)
MESAQVYEDEKSVSGTEETKVGMSDEDVEAIDLSTPCWFYLDSNQLKQGPFSFKEMFLWWKGGYFPDELMVKTIWENEFQQLGNIPEFYAASEKLVARIEREQDELVKSGLIEVPIAPTFLEEEEVESRGEDYAVTGTFNSKTGRFSSDVGPLDKDAKHMSKYFDHEQYQANNTFQDPSKRKKPVKGTKKFWKERKEKKKKAKLLADYLAD